MQTEVAIIGGGLAGLYAGKLLHSRGISFTLIEARERLGGRILTRDEEGTPTDDGFDLGPSWFWPEIQPRLAALVHELGLATFSQHNEGEVIFERMSRETPWRYRATQQEPQSLRIAGGTGMLIRALEKQIPGDSILVGTRVRQMILAANEVSLSISKVDGTAHTLTAKQVIAAVPPRLLAKLAFSPGMDSVTEQRWKETATWMAPHAKFFAIYERAFWRDAGLSGTAQSLVGPLGEIHDATTASGKAALFGFPSVGADARAAMGESAFAKSCLEQFARLYGPEARHPRATLFKDWAADSLTATSDDRNGGTHPKPFAAPWVNGDWQHFLSLGGSETSGTEPGYMAGAVSAAERAVDEVIQRLQLTDRTPNK
ncbi:MAG: FAD-dependent oxidoreductase [Acidobacteriota bacterium]|nr:FAD-dependent oxidoreductase [Acidobacteriota bacterium]